MGEQLIDSFKNGDQQIKKFTKFLELTDCQCCERMKGNFPKLADFIWKQTVCRHQTEHAARDAFIRKAILNHADELGNTMLHLAAWNNKAEMYDILVSLGAEQNCKNNDGLTAFTLSARFGLWAMFKHIWGKHFTHVVWSFGNVLANQVDYQQVESITSGLTSFHSVNEIEICIEALIHHHIEDQVLKPDSGAHDSQKNLIERKLEQRITLWCEKRLSDFLFLQHETLYSKKIRDVKMYGNTNTSNKAENFTRNEQKYEVGFIHVKNALRLITLFRPNDWYNQTKDLIEEVVLTKWSQGYYLVHIGDSLIPFCILILLFCLMWWTRRLSVLEHSFWWASSPIRAPDPNNGLEGTCGWQAIQDSFSGRIQAVLILYGVPSLIRLALVQCRIRPSDLDENVDWRISTDEIINFMYLNLESILHIIIAGLFTTIGVARVAAGTECKLWAIHVEKSATSMAALSLFFNLFILCKPYKGFGLLVLTWYRFLLADVFNFLVMYGMIFLAFLIALQTLHNASYDYLFWMDQTDTIFPQVQAAINKIYPKAASNLTYLFNADQPVSNQLLSANIALDGCLGNRRSIQDTAFSLLEISFGDGLADALEQARSKDYECAGFAPDYLVGYLLVFWVFLTNTLIMNMLISMMNNTFNKQRDTLSAVWLLDISKRVMRYELNFCELGPRMHRTRHLYSWFSSKYWISRLEDLGLIMYCIPEVHKIILASHLIHVWAANHSYFKENSGGNSGKSGLISWKEVQSIIEERIAKRIKTDSNCEGFLAITNWLWRPHMLLVHNIHNTSHKVVVFGRKMEEEDGCRVPVEEEAGAEYQSVTSESSRLSTLIFRLEILKGTMHYSKRKIVDRVHATASEEMHLPETWGQESATYLDRESQSGESSTISCHYPSPSVLDSFVYRSPMHARTEQEVFHGQA
jgi:hypothetical protein